MREFGLFLGQMIRKPAQVSALAPSSRHLARALAEPIGPQTGLVAEFGPGTGTITRAILDRGLPPENLTLFELNPVFARRLHSRFPGVRVENRPAQDIGTAGLSGLDAVISGLPLLSMNEQLQHAILSAAFQALKPGGIFVQFTYGPRPPLAHGLQHELGLEVRRGPQVLLNMPPARVYHYHLISAQAPRAA